MTTQPDFDRVLGAWLREVPPHSDRARVAVLAQVGATRQQRPRLSWLSGTRSGSPRPRLGMSRWGFSLMRPIAVVALIGLGTGAVYLAAGQGPSPSPIPASSATASPTAAPSTKPLTGLLARLVTEDVEPGVLRVVSDGYRNLAPDVVLDAQLPRPGFRQSNVVAGSDGSVWLFGAEEWYRVGEAATYPVTDETPNLPSRRVQVAPDGILWTLVGLVGTDDDGSLTLQSFEDGSWTVRMDRVRSFDLEADGTVWVNSDRRFVRIRDGWQTPVFGRADGFWIDPLTPFMKGDGDEVGVLVHTDGSCPSCHIATWWLQEDGDTHSDPAGELPGEIVGVDMDGHGDHWIYQTLDVPEAGVGQTDTVPTTRAIDYIVHVTGASSTVYTDEQGVPPLARGALGSVFRAAPDGSVWLAPRDDQAAGRCGGLANFDGTTWTRYLPGRCIHALDIAPDGTVWLQAAAQGLALNSEEIEKSEKAETLAIPG